MSYRRRRLLALTLSTTALVAVAVLGGDDWRSDKTAGQTAEVNSDAHQKGIRWETAAARRAPAGKKPLTRNATLVVDEGALLRERFAPIMSKFEKALLVRTLFAATSLLDSAGVPYFLYGGTLIGSVRHHGLVPWDDDVDIMTNASQRHLVRAALSGRSDYGLHSGYEHTYKWYSLHDAAAPSPSSDRQPTSSPAVVDGQHFRWPYIDVFFFEENATHVYDSETKYSPEYVYPKADVFPLTRRPFEGGWLLVPRDASAVLATTYDVSLCQTASYVHRDETYVKPSARLTVECSRLHDWFPFAFCNRAATASDLERATSRCDEESLMIGGRVIHTLRVNDSEGPSHAK